MADSFNKKLQKVEPHIIGIWKFRMLGKKPRWAATYHFEGNYYDIDSKVTIEDALDAVAKDLEKLRKKNTRPKKRN